MEIIEFVNELEIFGDEKIRIHSYLLQVNYTFILKKVYDKCMTGLFFLKKCMTVS